QTLRCRHCDCVLRYDMRGKSGQNVQPPPAFRYKKQCAEEDDVWRPEWRKNPIRQRTDGESCLGPEIIPKRQNEGCTEGLEERRQLHASRLQPLLAQSMLFEKECGSLH